MTGQETEPFGGQNMVLFGDLLQLPPVNANYCFRNLTRAEVDGCFSGTVAVIGDIMFVSFIVTHQYILVHIHPTRHTFCPLFFDLVGEGTKE